MELLDCIDWIAKRVRQVERPMGGIQVVMIGDVCQLVPVYVEGPTKFFFEAAAWHALDTQTVILTKVFSKHQSSKV